MYEDVYESLVQAGNASKIDEFTSKYYDLLKTNFHLTHHEMFLWWMKLGVTSVRMVTGILQANSTFVR